MKLTFEQLLLIRHAIMGQGISIENKNGEAKSIDEWVNILTEINELFDKYRRGGNIGELLK